MNENECKVIKGDFMEGKIPFSIFIEFYSFMELGAR